MTPPARCFGVHGGTPGFPLWADDGTGSHTLARIRHSVSTAGSASGSTARTRRRRDVWRRLALVLAMLCSPFAATTGGRQDIAGLLAHESGAVERARLAILPDTFRTLKAATFAWPSASPLLSASAIPAPPRLLPLALEVARADKGDRLAPARLTRAAGPGLPVPVDRSGLSTDPDSVAAAAGTGTSELTSDGGLGTGTGLAEVASAGSGTDPFEIDDIADANDLVGSSLAGSDLPGPESAGAGDPTGDPAELEIADADAAAMADAEIAGAPARGSLTGPAYADPFRSGDGPLGFAEDAAPLDRQTRLIFGIEGALAERFFGGEDAGDATSSVATKEEDLDGVVGPMDGPSPAERLGLDGRRRARAEKCLAEAVYFESRGEPERGQIAVAQVVMNRVFSGYYPADVCRAVYQNARRKFACQFTFACDNVRDVVTEPRLWQQARRIASDMLDGRLWDSRVGRATHYHAQSVHPFWLREMQKLDEIGEHSFYRPRRWTS